MINRGEYRRFLHTCCRFFLMRRTEQAQRAGSSGGPWEGGKLTPTTELCAFNTANVQNCQQLQVLRLIPSARRRIFQLLRSGSGRRREGWESWFIHMCRATGTPPPAHAPSLESPCTSAVTPLPIRCSWKCFTVSSPPCCSPPSNQEGLPPRDTEPKLCVTTSLS